VIEHTLDTTHAIMYLRPKSALERGDFVSAEIRHFPAGELAAAKDWVMNRP
jgi:hypothetical protein